MGTNLQEVFDAFFAKFPSVSFTGKEDLVVQFFKSAIAKCKKRVYDNLSYSYDYDLEEGYFENIVSESTVELISMFMAKEYASQQFTIMSGRKQYIGTQAFNKIPSYKEEFEAAKQSVEFWTNEVKEFTNEFPDYSDER